MSEEKQSGVEPEAAAPTNESPTAAAERELERVRADIREKKDAIAALRAEKAHASEKSREYEAVKYESRNDKDAYYKAASEMRMHSDEVDRIALLISDAESALAPLADAEKEAEAVVRVQEYYAYERPLERAMTHVVADFAKLVAARDRLAQLSAGAEYCLSRVPKDKVYRIHPGMMHQVQTMLSITAAKPLESFGTNLPQRFHDLFCQIVLKLIKKDVSRHYHSSIAVVDDLVYGNYRSRVAYFTARYGE